MKIAFLFPGQGTQKVGMGKDIFEKYEEAREIYEKASAILGIDVAKLCFESTEEELAQTKNAQIAIVITSLAILEVLKKYNIEADICAGLSLGEYVGLIYSGYITFEDGLRLIQKRGYYMQEHIPEGQYAMAAIIGLDSKKIEEACLKAEGFVVPANYNYYNQTVISGEKTAVERAEKILKESGAKRVVELKTSGPFHTEKLNKAKELYKKELEKVKFHNGNKKVVKNLDGTIYSQNDNFVKILSDHITNPVRFDKEIETMNNHDIDLYIEIGMGKTLTGFIKKQNESANTCNVSSANDIEKLLEKLGQE